MSQLIELQNAIVAKIQSLPLVAQSPAIAVLPELLGDIGNRMARQGAATSIMVVVTPAQLYRAEDAPAPRTVTAKNGILIMENVLMNRQIAGYRTAPDIAEAVGQGLHNWMIPGAFGTARTTMAECLSLEYGYVTEALWAVPLSQFAWVASETECPLAYRVRLETQFEW